VVVGVCVLGFRATPLWCEETAFGTGDSPDLPTVDLTGLEPVVAKQISALQSHAASVLAGKASETEKGEAVGELGRLYHAYELSEPAESCYRQAIRLAPRDFRWRYHLGYLLQTGGRLEEAVSEYERALGIFAEVPPALVRLGQVYLALNQTEAAEEVLRRALELDSASAAAYAVLGEAYLAQERYPEAVAGLERALDYVPEADRLYYPLAMAYRAMGEEEKARQLIAKKGPVGVRPADPLIDSLAGLTTGERVHLLRGQAAFGAERYAEAVEEFAAAAAANPASVSARVNLGSALAQEGDVEAAIEQYRAAIGLGPGNVAARYNLGLLLAGRGRLEEAAGELRQAVQYAPRDAAAHYELAAVLRRLGRHDDALTHFALSAELGPPGEEARIGRAGVLVDLGRYEQARTQLEEALAIIPSSGLIAFSLSRLLAACPDPAMRDGERALDLARRVHGARKSVMDTELVAEALAELGRCDEAAEWQAEALTAITGLTESGSHPVAALEGPRSRLARYRNGPPCRAATDPPPDAASP